MTDSLAAVVEDLGASGLVTAAAGGWAAGGEVRVEGWKVDPGAARFDLASLTKPFVATLALALHRAGELDLAAPLGTLLPVAAGPLAAASVDDLLRHRAGLRAWLPLFAPELRDDGPLDVILGPRAREGPGERYSDLGYVLVGRIVERAAGRSLLAALRERVLAPLELEDEVGGPPGRRPEVVRSELSNAREVELAAGLGIEIPPAAGPWWGVPQDGNARFLGGVPGHAGLFGTVAGCLGLAGEWLKPGRVLSEELVRLALAGSNRYALGWWRAEGTGAYGMVGFTGGGVWVDPERGVTSALLAHRRTVADDLDPWRRRAQSLGPG